MLEIEEKTKTNFKSNLPKKPYCTNSYEQGLFIRSIDIAIKLKYLQPQKPNEYKYLVYDIDFAGALEHIKQNNLPTPQIATINRENGHSHLIYVLKTSIHLNQNSSEKAIRYYEIIFNTLGSKLKADPNYSNLICKNPLNDNWTNLIFDVPEYELKDFTEYFDIENSRKAPKKDQFQISRNIQLFDLTRFYAYSIVETYRQNSTKEIFETVILKYCEIQGMNLNTNTKKALMLNSEFKATARSIARWTWKHYKNPNSSKFQRLVQDTHTKEKQAERGKKSGVKRLNKTIEQRTLANMYSMLGFSQNDLMKMFNRPQKTISDWLLK